MNDYAMKKICLIKFIMTDNLLLSWKFEFSISDDAYKCLLY